MFQSDPVLWGVQMDYNGSDMENKGVKHVVTRHYLKYFFVTMQKA